MAGEDYFARLGQARRPWLEAEALKASFHAASAQHHPDRAGGDEAAFAQGTKAYGVLREPATRLRHLLELEAPEALTAGAGAAIPPHLAERFMRLGTLKRAVEAFLRQQQAAAGPLEQAVLAADRFALRREVEQEAAGSAQAYAEALTRLRALDEAWTARDAEVLAAAVLLAAELAYYAKWEGQLREMAFQLSRQG